MKQKITHSGRSTGYIQRRMREKNLRWKADCKKVFHLYGYHDIQTPTIEYFDVFREEIGTTPANDLYKLF